MDFILENWLDEIKNKILNRFKDKAIFIGYQGSYRRGEASENSDIDMVVVLDEFNFDDLITYKSIVQSMPFPEKACGFICGKKELLSWSKFELFQLLKDTEALHGDLSDYITVDAADAKYAVKINAQALYHSAVHSCLYDTDMKSSLISLYKLVFFILQAKYYADTEEFIGTKSELIKWLSGVDKDIMSVCISRNEINKLSHEEVEDLYKKLITWCADLIAK